MCISLVTESKGNFVQNEYFDYLQRGGLSVPTDIVKWVLFHFDEIFEKIINDSATENDFLNLSNQKAILCDLALLSIKQDNSLHDFLSVCFCGKKYEDILIMLCSIFSNILLNNYVKTKNNESSAEKSEKNKNRKRKLSTFK